MSTTRGIKNVVALAFLVVLSAHGSLNALAGPTITVADTIETRRILPTADKSGAQAVRYSPDGSRYLVVLYRGDVTRNVNVLEFFSGGTASMDDVARGKVVATLYSEEHAVSVFRNTDMVWLSDNERIALIENSRAGPHRIVAVNTRTGAIETLVTWPRPINSFDLSADGRTVLFVSPSDGAEAKEVYEKLMSSGFTMRPDQGALSLMGVARGHVTVLGPMKRSLLFEMVGLRGSSQCRGTAPGLWTR